MSLILPLSPLHLPSLLLSRLPPDETWSRDRLADAPRSAVKAALHHVRPFRWQAWVAMRGPWVSGLIGASYLGYHTWEISALSAVDGDEALFLLGWACRHLAMGGGQRLLMRLQAESPLEPVAHKAGFLALGCEDLYLLSETEGIGGLEPLAPLTPLQLHQAFQLYIASAPSWVRALEGPTLGQWRASFRGLGRGQDLGLWHKGQLLAWVRLWPGAKGTVAMALIHPSAQGRAKEVAARALQRCQRQPVYFLVPSYQQGLAAALEGEGFPLLRRFVNFLRPLAQLAPAVSETASHQVRGWAPIQ